MLIYHFKKFIMILTIKLNKLILNFYFLNKFLYLIFSGSNVIILRTIIKSFLRLNIRV